MKNQMKKNLLRERLWQAAASLSLLLVQQPAMAQDATTYSGSTIAAEGAWCWFADPRAMHYTSKDGKVDAAYVGYIDVHGNIKASMFDGDRQQDVLMRSYFQPDDHDNPTFLALPDGRIMAFYTRHTDESCFYYRISTVPGDITRLGEEKKIVVANNTTYPSPFILSDDPDHIYLCWRGIGWHPTIAKLTMPDQNDDVKIAYGPYQMVQSTGARPYAKYQSNGKDKIYVSYTTGHPDNEYPNWLYFNVININAKKAADGTVTTSPQLCDLKGNVLSTIAKGKFNVSKTDSYKSKYAATLIDAPTAYRDWVWQITLDKDDNPVVAMVRISNDKSSHEYYYARWNGQQWKLTDLANGGGRFHSSNTELCYSGGMAIDPDTVSHVYLSVPTPHDVTGQKVYEIWKYTVDGDGRVTDKTPVTRNSAKNNVRPFILPGSAGKKLRLCWMNGDYYYWIVSKNYPKGYPTALMGDFTPATPAIPTLAPVLTDNTRHTVTPGQTCRYALASAPHFTLLADWQLSESAYGGTMLTMGNLEYGVDKTMMKPYIKIGDRIYSSQNVLGTSDAWASNASGTDGKWYLTKLKDFATALTYDGKTLTVYRNGWIDQRIDLDDTLSLGPVEVGGFTGLLNSVRAYDESLDQYAVRALMGNDCLERISLPDTVYTDIVLPTTGVDGQTVTWTSDREDVLANDGIVHPQDQAVEVALSATLGSGPSASKRTFEITVAPRQIEKNLKAAYDEIDLTANTSTGFSSNRYETVPEGLLSGLRSYTALMKVNAKSLSLQPRLYDFGAGSANSLFLRANPLSAGIKYQGGATAMVNASRQLSVGKDYCLAVTFDAETHTTRIFIDGEEVASGTACQAEPWQLVETAADSRNYIGRTQWWDSQYANDNADFQGLISNFRFYDIDLSRKEICQLQGLAYVEKELPAALQNGDFEGAYSVYSASGVKADRAIYQPTGWTVDYTDGNENDLTALKAGDLYFSNFFASRPAPSASSKQTYWIRQNWGTPTLTLLQELCLPAGDYTLTADVWKSGLGGDIVVSVATEGGVTVKAPALTNQEAWQQVSVDFTSDGKASTTVSLSAVHTSSGSEKIIGFDNVTLDKRGATGVNTVCREETADRSVFNMAGQKVARDVKGLPAGLYIQGKRKVVVR